MPLFEMVTDTERVQFKWMSDEGHQIEILDPVTVQHNPTNTTYRDLAGNEFIIRPTWDVCIVVKRRP